MKGIRALLVLSLTACGDGADTGDAGPDALSPPEPWPVTATLVEAGAEGRLPAGKLGSSAAILPGGRMVTPAGAQIEVGGFLLGVRLLPGGPHVVTTDGGYYDEYLTVVDPTTASVVQEEPFRDEDSRGLFLGLALRADGRLFASGGGTNAIYEYGYDPAAAAPLAKVGEIALLGNVFVSGLAFLDATRLVAAYQLADAVAVIDTTDGSELARADLVNGDEPYDVAVDPVRQEAYVSLWGRSAVAVIDLASSPPDVAAVISTGKNPEALLLYPPAAPTSLLVANSDSDTVSVVDLDLRAVVDSVEVGPAPASPRGSAPNHLAVSPDGARLYVANAGENCLDVFATADWTRAGRIPTAWYPTGVAAQADGSLIVTNAKGLGGGPSSGTGFDYGIMRGTLSLVPPQTDADLTAGAATVEANNNRPAAVGPHVTCPPAGECRWPLPPMEGFPTPIEHVVLIVRENKTYDATLGDLGTDAEGDPALVLFGEEYTPNLHALARQFTNGDNFYSNAEASIQGHQWTTAGTSNDFTEKAWLTTWGREQRTVADFGKEISAPEQGYYWQHLDRAGIDYMDYGEIIGFAGRSGGDPAVTFDPSWPGGIVFNTDGKDVDKAVYFSSRVLDEGFLPTFTYVLLPNNHTNGLEPGKWTPEYMVSDNDEATGIIVDAISHSRFWYTTVVFIIEDDPQDGADHVEAHRSTLVVASPWVKRGFTVKTHYDNPSLWRTIELLLGLSPRSQATASAAPMFDIWATEPDWTPYTYLPGTIPEAFNPMTRSKLARQSEAMDFKTLDNAPGLGRVLWEHMKGEPAPWASMPLPLDLDDSDSDSDDD